MVCMDSDGLWLDLAWAGVVDEMGGFVYLHISNSCDRA